jgi:hypothetical protein
MSMPEFPKPENVLTKEQAINSILTSIAMEEAALSHIVNAEGEKIQYAIAHTKCNNNSESMQKLLEINKSAANLIEQVGDIQILLKSKMCHVLSYLPVPVKPCPPVCPDKPDVPRPPCKPPEPDKPNPCRPPCKPVEPDRPIPCRPPCKPSEPDLLLPCWGYPCKSPRANRPCQCKPDYAFSCTSVFSARTKCDWSGGGQLCLRKEAGYDTNIDVSRRCQSFILLPAGRRFLVSYEFEGINRCERPVSINMELFGANEVFHVTSLVKDSAKYRIYANDSLILETPEHWTKCALCIKLNSSHSLRVYMCRISITEERS